MFWACKIFDTHDAVVTNWIKVRGTTLGGMYDRIGRVNQRSRKPRGAAGRCGALRGRA
jgi:hypothetical protein